MKFFKILFVASVIALVTLPLAISIAPWLYCAATPVRLRMIAPLDTQVRISWDAGSNQSLPFVPQANADGVSANLWLAELPPRPVYHIALIFPSRLDHVLLRRFSLFDERQVNDRVFDCTSNDPTGWFTTEGIESTYANKNYVLNSPAGGRVIIPATIDLSPQSHRLATFGLWLALFAIASVALLLIVPVFKTTANNLPLYAPGSWEGSWPIWGAFVVGTFIHVTLILHSPVVLAGGDSSIYLIKGITLARHFKYDTDPQFDLDRLPGYPLLICLMVKTIGYRLTRIAVAQGLFFCSSMLCLALATRKWIHPLVGGIAVLVAVLSPAEVWGSRTILSESTFATFSYFAIAAYFISIGSPGMRSKRWLIAFGCLAAYAVFIRPNGVSLYVGLVPAYLPAIMTIVRNSSAIGEKIRAAARVTLLYIVTGSILVAAILGWSIRNYGDRGYFGASDMTGVTLVCGLMVSGTFDVNSLVSTGQYDQYILRKFTQGYYYSGFFLRSDIYLALTDKGTHLNRDTMTKLDKSLIQIARDSKRISPWQVHATGLLRSLWWGVTWPDATAYSQDGIRLDYVTFDNNSGTRRGAPSPDINYIRNTYIPNIPGKLVYDEQRPNWIFSAFSQFAELYYNGWYVALSGLALLSGIYTLWRGYPALAAPVYAFIANILVNVSLLNVFSRYIHILDALLVFQIALGVSLLLRKMAKSTAA